MTQNTEKPWRVSLQGFRAAQVHAGMSVSQGMLHVMARHLLHSRDFSDFSTAWRLLAGWTIWGMLSFVAVIISLRGLAGGLVNSPSTASYLCWIVSAGWVGMTGFFLIRPLAPMEPFSSRRFPPLMWACLVPVLLLGVAFRPASPRIGLLILAIVLLLMIVCMAAGPELARWYKSLLFRSHRTLRQSLDVQPQSLAEQPIQSLIRQQRGELDELRGQCLVEFAAGQRVSHVHVAFCPPFASIPQLECDLTDVMAEPRVKIAAIYPHGMRLEARRSDIVEEPTLVPVDFIARCAANGDASTSVPHG